MSEQSNKDVVKRLADQVFNEGDLALMPELLAEDFVDHSAMPETPSGIEGYQGFVMMVRTAFPDFHFTLEDTIAEGDRVVIRGSMSGSNTGPFMDMPATGKPAKWTGTHTYRLADGKIVEHWGNIDMFGLMKQLGHVP
jgi:steroid delta-isomerase-like uncharacterized protein